MQAKNRVLPFRRHQLFLGLALSIGCSLVYSQEPVADESTVNYPASYFTQFSPNTVSDMLDRIPGIGLAMGGHGPGGGDRGNRGLGNTSQILINGKRMAGKANEARSALDRITARQVNYIEIVRDTSSALDAQSNSGQMVNIVLLEELSTTNLTSEISATHFEDGKVEPNGSLALTGQNGRLNYLISGNIRSGYQRTDSFEGSINGDFSPNDTVKLTRYRDQTNYSLNSNLGFQATDRDRIAANFLYNTSEPQTDLNRIITNHNTAIPKISYEREDIPASAESWEIGGDYQHTALNGNRFKVLAIVNEKSDEVTRERFGSASPGGSETKNLYLYTDSRYRERIVRGSYTWGLSPTQGLELGIEGAQTLQDSILDLGRFIPGALTSPAFGGLTPIAQPNSHSEVEEIRYEPFAIHNWRINSRMTLESSLVAEFSEITQSGDVYKSRDFNYLKPKLEKIVSQLTFADFSANVHERDEDQDTVAGNPLLEPEESLRAEIIFDYRLPNDGGSLNARYFYQDWDNKIGKIDISPSATVLRSTNGNIGPAELYGMSLNGSLRLGFIGLPNALFTGNITFQESEFDYDPLVPMEHGFFPFDRGFYNLGFRHDVAALNLNYGVNAHIAIDDGRFMYDISDRTYIPRPSRIMAWVEKTGYLGLTYRFEGGNLFEHEACTQRRRYQAYVLVSPIREIENICTTNGAEFSFKVRGTF
jgi:outer membrane receptor for ferrienterochelin and colicins